MDDIVLRGMARWPNVPAVYGWLSLDRRGQWLIKGERISNPTVTAFIGRNYERDGRGCWFFQNGPQRVFVQLDYAPLVLRVAGAEGIALEFEAHTGKRAAAIEGAWLDEDGSLILSTDLGPGLIDDRDLPRLETSFVDANGTPLPEAVLDELMELAAQQRAVPLWLGFRERSVKVDSIRSGDVPARFGFVRDPQPPKGSDQ
ncbi:MAG TPA: DUF2946 family protein [Burkholderiales bacterium]|jgi:hypothetical protein|nr:DUF2946 family protein [Burkholderiales bacterium]